MENPGSISLPIEKKSLQLTKFLKKNSELFFFPERQCNRKKSFKVMNIAHSNSFRAKNFSIEKNPIIRIVCHTGTRKNLFTSYVSTHKI